MKDETISIRINFEKGDDTSIIDILKSRGYKNLKYQYRDTDSTTKDNISQVAFDIPAVDNKSKETLESIYKEMEDIINDNTMTWRNKYYLISIKAFDIVKIKYNKNTSFEEDSRAFFAALGKHIQKMK